MESIRETLQMNAVDLAALCTAFLQSKYYSKAMGDARYERMQAIRDFLTTYFSSQIPPVSDQQLHELALTIRENYYRYF